MGIFKRKNKTAESVTGFTMVHNIDLPLIPFGDNILKSDVVMVCIDKVASQCAKLKARYIKTNDAGVQSEKNNDISFVLKYQPNIAMTPYQFIYKTVSLLLLNDNAFVYPLYDRQTHKLKGLYPLDPMIVQPQEYTDGSYTYKFYFKDGESYEIPIENVIHLKRFYCKNDFFGGTGSSGNHEALLKTLKTNESLLQGVSAAIESSFKIKGLLKINGILKETDKNKQLDEFSRAVEKATKGNSSIIPMDTKADYVPLETNPKIVESTTLDFIQSKILDYYGVSKGVFSNKYDENEYNSFYESTIEPIAIQLSEAFSLGLLTDGQLERGEQILFFSERLQYASWHTKVNAIGKLIGLGIMSLNESRNLLGLEPVEGGDKRLQSLNYVDATKANLYQVGEKEDEDTS
ncbi:MAG: phage portal protein [Anaeroplasmataceae bacterium]|nr:phage portal protein [Anaeroplasmataceae bacterium]